MNSSVKEVTAPAGPWNIHYFVLREVPMDFHPRTFQGNSDLYQNSIDISDFFDWIGFLE